MSIPGITDFRSFFGHEPDMDGRWCRKGMMRMVPTKDAKGREMGEGPELIYRDEAYRIVGVCFEVYKEKGCGFLEPVYQECLEIEFRLQGIPFVA